VASKETEAWKDGQELTPDSWVVHDGGGEVALVTECFPSEKLVGSALSVVEEEDLERSAKLMLEEREARNLVFTNASIVTVFVVDLFDKVFFKEEEKTAIRKLYIETVVRREEEKKINLGGRGFYISQCGTHHKIYNSYSSIVAIISYILFQQSLLKSRVNLGASLR